MEKHAPPLAFRVRPANLQDLIGQEAAKAYIEDFGKGNRTSAILWGPPGSGKTTVAHIIERLFPDEYVPLSAVTSGVQDLRRVTGQAEATDTTPIVFIDEIHRFNKAQQDALLPHVENGRIVLIGATTENPSFAVIAPLLSRMRVIVLRSLKSAEISEILKRALADDIVMALGKHVAEDCVEALARAADGDARAALNLLEFILTKVDKSPIEKEDLEGLLQRPLYHDRMGDYHYDLISAFHKCIRAGDADASVYWLSRMLEAGEDRLYIIRRMLRMASEDIGMAEPNALRLVLSVKDAFAVLGIPEGDLALYQAAVYLALAPKSNALYRCDIKTRALIDRTGTPPVPLALRNAPTKLMAELGYAHGYIYAHDDPSGALDLTYMPAGLEDETLYTPHEAGFEKKLKEIMDARAKAKRDRTASHRPAAGKKS